MRYFIIFICVIIAIIVMKKEIIKDISIWFIKTGTFIIPFIPLYVSTVLFFPYITGKAFVFRIIVEVIFSAWIFLAIFYEEYSPKKSPLLIAVSIFISAVVLATIFSVNPYKSFWSNFERMEGLVTYLHLFAYFLVLGQVFKKQDWNIFFNLFVISGILESIYAWFQRFGYFSSIQGGFGRPDGTIGNPTYLAAYLIFILFFCLWLLFNSRNSAGKFFYGLSAFFVLATIYLTASRGPGLAVIGSAILGIILYLALNTDKEAVKKYKSFALILLSIFILVPGGIWLARNTDFVKNNLALSRLTSLSLSERTVASRFVIWRMGLEGFMEHPILGWGPDNYELVFAKYFKSALWRQESWFDRSHNIVLDWLINAGILGLVSYLSIFGAAFYLLWKVHKKNIFSLENALLIAMLFLAYFFQNLFVFDNLATYLSFFGVLAFIHSSQGAGGEEKLKSGSSKFFGDTEQSWFLATGLLAAPLLAIIYFVNLQPLFANLSLLEALKIQGSDSQGAFNEYQKALSYNTLGNKEIREQLTRFAIMAGSAPELAVNFKDLALRTAITEDQKSVLENPLDPRAYIFLGSIFNSVGLFDQALAVFNKAVELSPKKQQIYFELADVYFRKGDSASAVNILEKSFNLDPEFNQARMNLAIAYIISNQQSKADELLKEYYGTVEVEDQLLVQVYSKIKDYRRLAGVWRTFVKTHPDNIGYWKNLSGAYLLAGERKMAIAAINEAIILNPGFKAEGEVLIRDILTH